MNYRPTHLIAFRARVDLFLFAVLILFFVTPLIRAQTSAMATNSPNNPLLNALIHKGILTEKEAKDIQAESDASQTSLEQTSDSRWKLPASIKSLGIFGDVRFRYEYRGVDAIPGSGADTFRRERFRYAVRLGLRGDMFDDISYGIRLETSTNPRSPWVTFADDSSPTPSDKHSDTIGIGQVYIGWKPADWFQMTVGRMPMPLYTTPMVWDADICPEGAFEKFSWTYRKVDFFADFAQFDYQNPASSSVFPSSDVFLFAWQAGANINFRTNVSFKVAPVLYDYSSIGSVNGANAGLSLPFTGQGNASANPNFPGGAAFNQNGINDLLIFELPMEFNFPINTSLFGKLNGRFFGDFAINLNGSQRAREAASVAGLPHAYTGDVKAFQFGFGVGSAGLAYGPMQGLVYGTTSKKRTWEARVYWQHVEQYALDVNLLDSDFFEGRGNLEGYYTAFSYSFTDALISTLRFGYAQTINPSLGTGGSNLDIPGINPINHYRLAQLDLTLRF